MALQELRAHFPPENGRSVLVAQLHGRSRSHCFRFKVGLDALRVFSNLRFYELVEDAAAEQHVFLDLCTPASEAGEDLEQTMAESRSDGF